jgi:protein SCO1/2
MVVVRRRRFVAMGGVLLATATVLAGCAGKSAAPAAPSAYLGTVLDKPVPAEIARLPLTDENGRTTSLAALHGQIVVLTDFLTLCQETCPLTTGNLLDMDQTVTASGLAGRVHFVELTVDPGRDTPARLSAYRELVGAPANWSLFTGNPATVQKIWRYFGIWYETVPEGAPPGVDWLTGRRLTYDVSHEDALIYLDAAGRERFLVAGSPNATGSPVPPVLRQFLSGEGRAELAHPDASTWTASEALTPIAWLAGEPIHPVRG